MTTGGAATDALDWVYTSVSFVVVTVAWTDAADAQRSRAEKSCVNIVLDGYFIVIVLKAINRPA